MRTEQHEEHGATMNTPEQIERAAILAALTTWINQRPGLDWRDYGGDGAAYRAEVRGIGRDLHEARRLLAAVAWRRESVTVEILRDAFRAFAGRLSWNWDGKRGRLGYTTGQYWPTEYRRAACAVLASALWAGAAASMPAESGYQVQSWTQHDADGRTRGRVTSKPYATREAAEAELVTRGGSSYGHVQALHDGICPGDWLRRYFRREFGRGLASRWFS